jgi:hypothetical protein
MGAFDWWIWFEHIPPHLELICDKSRNTLVPSWHKLTAKHESSMNLYSEIVAPTLAVKRALDQKEFTLPVHCVPWDAPGEIQAIHPKPAGYYCRMPERFTAKDTIRLAVIDHLLAEGYPVTLVKPITTLPQNILKIFDKWSKLHKQFTLLPASTVLDHLARMAKCRWSVILDSADNLGYACLESLSLGMPVICYDIPPRDEYLKQGQNSILLDCNLELSYLGAPRAIVVADPNAEELRDSLWTSTRTRMQSIINQSLSGFKDTPDILIARREGFKAHWEHLARST